MLFFGVCFFLYFFKLSAGKIVIEHPVSLIIYKIFNAFSKLPLGVFDTTCIRRYTRSKVKVPVKLYQSKTDRQTEHNTKTHEEKEISSYFVPSFINSLLQIIQEFVSLRTISD